MATFSSSSSSSQGSVPGVMGKGPQTPGDLIIYSLEDLKGHDFKRFKNKLSDFSYGDKLPIPRGKLEKVDWITTKDLLMDTYGDEGALDITTEIFTLIGLMGPANDLQKRRAQNAKLKKITQDNRFKEFRKEYREYVKEFFQQISEYNSRLGETVSLQKRFTKLLMRKGLQKREEKEQELWCTGRRHLQAREKCSSNEYSPTTIQTLFDTDEDDFIPKIVVLQGPAGIGKTMTSKKIMLDWACENLYQDKFDFVFYLSCRELNTITGNINLVGLLSRTCRLPCSDYLVSILKDPGRHRKLLFIVDGFDELRWTLEEESEVCHDVFEETHKERVLQRLLRKQVLQQSSVIITTRSLAMKKLNTFINKSRNVEVQGFTGKNLEEYVHTFFGNKEDADKVLGIIREDDILYTMCAVPITCWIVCTVIKQEIKKDLSLVRCNTMTSIYLLYLEVLLNHHSKKDLPVDERPWVLNTCLKKLCALANEGVLNQQILFQEKDLKRHGLSLSEVESVFLNENIFHWDVRTQISYSFIHLSVQEFLAALYYGLDYNFGTMKRTSLPNICKGKSLSGLSSDYPHLALAVQFLYGLLNEKEVKTFSESTGINISLQSISAMKNWAIKDIDQTFLTQTIFCLYETQDEDFIRSMMSCSNLKLKDSDTSHLWMNSSYSKQLGYCLTTLKTESFQSIGFDCLTLDPDCQKRLSPLLQRCQNVWFLHCTFHEEDSTPSEDEMNPDNISFLINPESKIQELCLLRCGLTSSSCDDLRSVLITNHSLTRLDISNNRFDDSGIKLLCEGLQHPSCTLRELRLGQCSATFLCCEYICPVITTNRTLTTLEFTLVDSHEEILDSEKYRCLKIFQHAGFTVKITGAYWFQFRCRRSSDSGCCEPDSYSLDSEEEWL